jgi:hypothetical protein
MAGKKQTVLPPAPEARAELLAQMRASEAPLAARDLKKRLAPQHQMAAAQIAAVLEEYVAAGTLHELPGKSARSKPRYWDRDPRAVCCEPVVEAVQRADAPHTANELRRRLVLPIKMPEAELSQILEEAARHGKVHSIPPATAKGKPRYWSRDALTFGQREILRTIREKGPQSESAIKRVAKGLNEAQIRQALEAALAAGELWRHPPVGKSKRELFSVTPPSPEPYLREVGGDLVRVVGELRAAGVPQEHLRRALLQIVEATGISFGSIAARQPPPDSARPVSVDLVALMRRIEPGADRGALVGARDLRRAAKLEKPSFDREVLELARQGRLSLHRHDFPASLSQVERDELVTDGTGTFYVGMALRNGTV